VTRLDALLLDRKRILLPNVEILSGLAGFRFQKGHHHVLSCLRGVVRSYLGVVVGCIEMVLT
jgi:hypothetical protein